MKENLIVTGGLGFIGKNFCYTLKTSFRNKIIIDKATYASDLDFFYSHLKPAGWKLIISDINEIQKIDEIAGLEGAVIVNFAAESHVDHSFTNARHFLEANALGTLSVLDFCRISGSQLLHISTDEVYGEVIKDPATERSMLNPTNPYSATKAAADLLAQTYNRCFNVDVKIIRANNVFGRRQLSEKVIPKAIERAIFGFEFEIHGSKDLKRHFLHTDDFTKAVEVVLDSWETSEFRVFNIAGDQSYFIRDLVSTIYDNLNASKSLIINGKDRAFNDQEYLINDDRIRSLGWQPRVDFWDAIGILCKEHSYFKGR